jgi:peptidase M15-like protein
MPRRLISAVFAVLLVLAVAGCGDRQVTVIGSTAAQSSLPRAHPQAIEPLAGAQATIASPSATAPIGDPNAHARSLADVKHLLVQLNLCGGATSTADAQPVVAGAGPGFVADPGTTQNVGQLPELTARLNALARALHVTIYGISGYRTPAHSVAVGGFADDPHTKGEAEDIGVNSLLRSSAAQISEADLARFGLYRPFDPSDDPSNSEVNHIQLIPYGGPVPVTVADTTFLPDPSCT